MTGSGNIPKELAEHRFVPYVSSERPLITLYMDVVSPARGGPWPPLLLFHGWHQDLTAQRDRASALAAHGFCVLNLNLRGRYGTVGRPDANGWEIRDAVDAVDAARRNFPQLCAGTLPPRAFGGSGGGGNVLALVGKCPDFLASAVAWCGISDYAAWWEWNEQGNYRDEMEPWIGGTPQDNREGYASRSGITVAPNRMCPLLVLHGKEDECVPVLHAKQYRDVVQQQVGETPLFECRELEDTPHKIPDEPHLDDSCAFLLEHSKPVYVPQRGRWIVAGFLKTHYFEAQWDHIGLVGTLDLDLRRRRLYLECPSTTAAQIRLAGPVSEPELLSPIAPRCRILSLRQEAGWSVIDLQLHGQKLGMRWKV